MHALPLMLGTLCVLAIGYRYYSAFIAARVLSLDDARVTPAHARADGKDFIATNRWVLFGHHFAAITGAGPLIGPVLAAQFGYLPGLAWILVGVTLGGAVHDFVILTASVRRGGRSLAEIAREEVGPLAGAIASIAIFFTVAIAIAAMAFTVVNILAHSAWATFTIGATIPIAVVMGLLMKRHGHGSIPWVSALGVALLVGAVFGGRLVHEGAWASAFNLSPQTLVYAICAYGFAASVLPVWLLLVPRDYLSAYMKVATIAALVVGILVVNPQLRIAEVSQFLHGGPIIKGGVFPFVFITVACGAISGFHSLIASGTTPKMIDRERDCRAIGYGAMLVEGLVGVTSLIAAACLHPSDYFAINLPGAAFAKLGMSTVDLPSMSAAMGEDLAGRTGGSVSLAVGVARIFSAFAGGAGGHVLAYWYHFIVMFEAVFILTTVDAGTRVARFLVQETLGRASPALGRTDSRAGATLATGIAVLFWGGFLRTGSIQTLWPLLGVANQLLATTALCVGTAVIVNMGRRRYAWVTAVPMAFVGTTTLTAGWLSITGNFLPLGTLPGYVDAACTALLMGAVVAILAEALLRFARGRSPIVAAREEHG
jgi:carbon starvation protein